MQPSPCTPTVPLRPPIIVIRCQTLFLSLPPSATTPTPLAMTKLPHLAAKTPPRSRREDAPALRRDGLPPPDETTMIPLELLRFRLVTTRPDSLLQHQVSLTPGRRKKSAPHVKPRTAVSTIPHPPPQALQTEITTGRPTVNPNFHPPRPYAHPPCPRSQTYPRPRSQEPQETTTSALPYRVQKRNSPATGTNAPPATTTSLSLPG